jgi:hypothetical protein
MLDSAKYTAKKYISRLRLAAEATAILLVLLAWAGAASGHIHGEFQVDGLVIGGGTEQHAAREQQLAALEAAMPVNALTPPVNASAASQKPQDGPPPQRKPVLR